MELGRFTIEGKDSYFEIVGFVETELKVDYKHSLNGGAIFFTEDYSFLNSSDLMIVIIVQQTDNSHDRCTVEIVAGGGGEGLFSIKFGNEGRRVSKASRRLHEFCKRSNFRIEEVE